MCKFEPFTFSFKSSSKALLFVFGNPTLFSCVYVFIHCERSLPRRLLLNITFWFKILLKLLPHFEGYLLLCFSPLWTIFARPATGLLTLESCRTLGRCVTKSFFHIFAVPLFPVCLFACPPCHPPLRLPSTDLGMSSPGSSNPSSAPACGRRMTQCGIKGLPRKRKRDQL